MVETRPRLLVEYMLLSFLLSQFGFRHGSSETTTELDPKEDRKICSGIRRLLHPPGPARDRARLIAILCAQNRGRHWKVLVHRVIQRPFKQSTDRRHIRAHWTLAQSYCSLSGSQLPHRTDTIIFGCSAFSANVNRLSGRLPPSFSNLSNLQSFWAASNDLTGEFPDYGSLNQLRLFSISGNYMSGRFPADFIRKWTQINYLTISDVANSGFQFPRSANLSNIKTL
ncbi:unnamed protein product [Prunus armeniaca]|uniref:Leucine-rich repeat-containing N-terminal plant-type domain-containing protein n=1 Tax=Prunus armeniaca TaxID=36596 RepID=A0A6J5VBC6_PRUAR|nr:unnamed protein product [Prunus armeniaca]